MALIDLFPLFALGAIITLFLMGLKFFANMRGMSLTSLYNHYFGTPEAAKEEVIDENHIDEDDYPKIVYKKYGFSKVITGRVKQGENPKTGRSVYHLRLRDGTLTPWTLEDDPFILRATDLWNALSGKKPREFEIVDDDRIAGMNVELNNKHLQVAVLQKRVSNLIEDEKTQLSKTAELHQQVRKTIYSGSPPSTTNPYGYRSWRTRRFVPPESLGGGEGGEETAES